MSDFKAWASRRLRETFAENAGRDRWTQHGSTRYLWTDKAVAEKVAYVVTGPGEPMALYDNRADRSEAEPEA